MSVLNTILGNLKTGLEGVTGVVEVYDYPKSFTNISSGNLPAIQMLVNGPEDILVEDADGKRLEAPVRVSGHVLSTRASVQSDLMTLEAAVKDYFDGLTASDLGTGCLSIDWIGISREILESRAEFILDVRITYYAAKGAN